jgi:hypothetical protein
MPNRRSPGTVVTSFAAPAALLAAAREKALSEGRSLGDVIREALRRYVG